MQQTWLSGKHLAYPATTILLRIHCIDLLARVHASCQQSAHARKLAGNAMCYARCNAGHVCKRMKPALALFVWHIAFHQQASQSWGVLGTPKSIQPCLLAHAHRNTEASIADVSTETKASDASNQRCDNTCCSWLYGAWQPQNWLSRFWANGSVRKQSCEYGGK